MDKAELRKLAEAASGGGWYDNGHSTYKGLRYMGVTSDCAECDATFIAAASPTTIIALLDEIEALTPTGLRKLDADTIRSLLDEIAAKDAEIERLREQVALWEADAKTTEYLRSGWDAREGAINAMRPAAGCGEAPVRGIDREG